LHLHHKVCHPERSRRIAAWLSQNGSTEFILSEVEMLTMTALLSRKHPILKDAIHCPQSVFPINFLSLGIRAPVIRYADFIYPNIRDAAYLDGYFRLKSKAFLLQVERLNNVTTEKLVARFHVRHVEIAEHVTQPCEHFITYGMPEEKKTMWSASSETRTIDNIGKPAKHGLQKNVVFIRIILEVGILNDHVISRSF
jgi:hypothetical protein